MLDSVFFQIASVASSHNGERSVQFKSNFHIQYIRFTSKNYLKGNSYPANATPLNTVYNTFRFITDYESWSVRAS